jgi:hypothetical protein
MDAALLEMIRAALPAHWSPDFRDDVAQEMVLGALTGEFDLSDLAEHVTTYRRRIYRLGGMTKRFLPIDAPIPGANRLTYADTLVG